MQLPIFSDGVTPITNDVGYERKENTVVYYCGTMPVFSHAVADLDSFRMIVSQLYVNGTVCKANLTHAFQIKPLALKRHQTGLVRGRLYQRLPAGRQQVIFR